VGKGLLIVEDSKSHSDKTYSVGLLWSSDKPDAETSFRQHNTHKTQSSMPPAGFEHAIPASEWPQTHASDRADTGIRKGKAVFRPGRLGVGVSQNFHTIGT